ncbi:MAG: hypothetical protein Q9219_007120 [cf. Caloplaca sp. 3 TL-2023]
MATLRFDKLVSIRQLNKHQMQSLILSIAVENLVPYSKTEPSIFKTDQLLPVKHLKLLGDPKTLRETESQFSQIYVPQPIAKNALTILINISIDPDILRALAEDDPFLETILGRITNPKEPTANLLSMLLANLAKSPSLSRLLTLSRPAIPSLCPEGNALDQLLALFNAGVHGNYNPHATFEHLPYLFADLAKFPPISTHLTLPPSLPILTLLPHLSPPSLPLPLRLGTITTLRNALLALPSPHTTIPPLIPHLLPSLLLPLIGPDPAFSDEETELLPPELQFLGPEHQREGDVRVLREVVEVVWLVLARGGGEKGVKEMVKGKGGGAYAVLREFHLGVEDEGVREGVERCVGVLMAGDGSEGEVGAGRDGRGEEGEEDEEGKIVDVF